MERIVRDSRIFCILDACSIINLLHIDEDGKLIERLNKLEILICEEVFKEVERNVFTRIGKFDRIAGAKSIFERKQVRKEIDQKLGVIRGWTVLNETINEDFGKDYFAKVAKMTSYKKRNGELDSTAIALALTRTEECKLFFHTDDFVAKAYFKTFYRDQQIGYIEDSADLLLLLYRLDEKFNLKELDELLSRLASEYNLEVSSLIKRLESFNLSAKEYQRTRKLRPNLQELLRKLRNRDFEGLNYLYEFFKKNKSKHSRIFEAFEKHKIVIELEPAQGSTNLIGKIRRLRARLKESPVHDLESLLSL